VPAHAGSRDGSLWDRSLIEGALDVVRTNSNSLAALERLLVYERLGANETSLPGVARDLGWVRPLAKRDALRRPDQGSRRVRIS